jgi:hypothetical protein
MKVNYGKIKETLKFGGKKFLLFFVDHLSISLILILFVGVGFAADVFYKYVWLVETGKPNAEVRVQKIKKDLLNSVSGDLLEKDKFFKTSGLPEKRDIFR